MTEKNFFAKVCNEIGFTAYKVQKEKQSRKGQAELTAQTKYFKSNQRRLIKMANEILKDEIMSEKELDKVAGGNRDELALDTQLFNAMGNRSKAYDLEDITNTNVNGISAKITSLYSKLGIQVSYNDFGASSYSVDGQARWLSRH